MSVEVDHNWIESTTQTNLEILGICDSGMRVGCMCVCERVNFCEKNERLETQRE